VAGNQKIEPALTQASSVKVTASVVEPVIARSSR
jgi:hypothetical protein